MKKNIFYGMLFVFSFASIANSAVDYPGGPVLRHVHKLFLEGRTPQRSELKFDGSWIQCSRIEATESGKVNSYRFSATMRAYDGLVEVKLSHLDYVSTLSYAQTPFSNKELFSIDNYQGWINKKTLRISTSGDLVMEVTVSHNKDQPGVNDEYKYPWAAVAFPDEHVAVYFLCPANIQ